MSYYFIGGQPFVTELSFLPYIIIECAKQVFII